MAHGNFGGVENADDVNGLGGDDANTDGYGLLLDQVEEGLAPGWRDLFAVSN